MLNYKVTFYSDGKVLEYYEGYASDNGDYQFMIPTKATALVISWDRKEDSGNNSNDESGSD